MGNSGRFIARDRESGYSIIEVMIGMILLGFIALAILPAMMTLNESLKVQAFRSQCNAIVRGKIQEYVNGVGAVGGVGVNPVKTDYIPSGFEYSKKRYYDFSAGTEISGLYYCQTNSNSGHPGFRERINTNKVISYTADGVENPVTPDLPDRLQGFQLFVNVRHFNPRVNAGEQPRRQCPLPAATYNTPASYQFFRLGDAIEVVVTGMIRTTPTVAQGGRSGKKFGTFVDVDANTPNPRLVCSATQIIYPPRVPFRYYLGVDGKIRNYQSNLTFSGGIPSSTVEAQEAHFRSVWSAVPGATGTVSSDVLGNVRSFAVSPENTSMYVLRPGEIKQYRNCSDRTVTMTKLLGGAVNYESIPDCTLGASPSVYTWRVDSNLENISVDFNDLTNLDDDKVYSLFNSGGNAAGDVRLLTLVGGSTATGYATAAASNFTLPIDAATRPRIRGIFLAPTFPPVLGTLVPNLFYFDNTCAAGAVSSSLESSHCVTVFNSGDTNMNRPSQEMPVQVEGISY